jgi:hypothetical protein
MEILHNQEAQRHNILMCFLKKLLFDVITKDGQNLYLKHCPSLFTHK